MNNMVKIGILLPYEDMLEMSESVLAEEEFDEFRRNVVCLRLIETANSVSEARRAVEEGAEIVLARGYQAALIRRYTNIPVVEIRLHAQEIGQLLKRSRELVKKERPVVSLVVFRNMVRDITGLGELFDVDLRVFYIEQQEDIRGVLSGIAKSGTDLVVGGHLVVREAEDMGFLAFRYGSSNAAMREAFYEAGRLSAALDQEKQSSAQFETLLDTTFHGIIKINSEGLILVTNRVVENLTGEDSESLKGRKLEEAFPKLMGEGIEKILSGEIDHYTTTVYLKKEPWVLLVAPIQYSDSIAGAILSLEKVVASSGRELRLQKDMFLGGYAADTTFDMLTTADKIMKRELERAKRYAASESPILIYSGEGTEYFRVAQAVHNASRRGTGPFVRVNIPALSPEMQEELIFGSRSPEGDKKSAVYRAEHGTLFLKGIECLTPASQYRMIGILRHGTAARTDFQGIEYRSVRFIAETSVSLKALSDKGLFSEELFYLLQGLTLVLPSLTQRPGDLEQLFEERFRHFSRKYGKYLVLTQGARRKITELPWPGNRIQLDSFCERLVLLSDKRSVDEVRIEELYRELFPKIREENGVRNVVVYRAPEADEIDALLKKYHGRRSEVARELGISTTTLWRKMKKYGIREK